MNSRFTLSLFGKFSFEHFKGGLSVCLKKPAGLGLFHKLKNEFFNYFKPSGLTNLCNLVLLIFVSTIATFAQTNNYFGTAGTISGTVWNTNPAGPFNLALNSTGGAIMNFNSNGTATGASVTVVGMNFNNPITWTAGGTIASGGVNLPISVSDLVTQNFGTQGFSTGAGFGVTKNGPGTLQLNGSAWPGGFVLNQGTVVAGGINAMGGAAGNTLVINGGTIAGSANRDFTGKFPAGISVNSDFTLGSTTAPALATASLTFTNNVNLGGATRTITLGGTSGTNIMSGIISNGGLTITSATNANVFQLGTSNTYAGGTTVNGATLKLGAATALLDAGAVTLNGAVLRTNNVASGTETAGMLNVTASSTIDFQTAVAHTLTFADGNITAPLILSNWSTAGAGVTGTNGKLFFSTPLSAAELAQISFTNYAGRTAMQLPTGQIVIAPGTLTVWASGADYTTLDLAQAAAFDGDTIKLKNFSATDLDEDIIKFPSNVMTVTKSIVIDGNGNTIRNNGDGVGAFQFTAPGETMVLQNITLCSFNRTGGFGSTIAVAGTAVDPLQAPTLVTFNDVVVTGGQSNTYAVRFESAVDWNRGSISGNENIGLFINNFGTNRVFTVNITDASISCNPGSGPEFGGGIEIRSEETGNAVDVNITGGSISNNGTTAFSYTATAIYALLGGDSNIDIDGTSFVGNIENSSSPLGIIRISDAYPGTTPAFSISNAKFEGNGNSTSPSKANLITSSNGGTITNSTIRGNSVTAFGTAATYNGCIFEGNTPVATPVGAPANTAIGGASPATNTSANFNYSGVVSQACTNCELSSGQGVGATITPCKYANNTDALVLGSVLSSNKTGTWYAQQGSTITNLGTGMSAVIPPTLPTGYTVFWQDVATADGTDPIMAGIVVAAPSIGPNDTAPANVSCMGSLSGNVFQDGNTNSGSANGINDESIPIVGVIVELLNSSGDVIATTTTNASGNYNFYNIPNGTYSVRITLPSGYYGSTYNNASGSNSSTDSDITQGTGSTNTISGISINLLNQATNGNDAFTGVSDYTNIGAGFVLVAQALPVTWSSISVKNNKCENIITWTTESETNNDYFVVERSKDGKIYGDAAMIDGQGDKRSTTHYEHKDASASRGVTYYRIKQVDFDGRFTYSPVVNVRNTSCADKSFVTAYPNPGTDNHVTLEIPEVAAGEDITIIMYNHVGQAVKTYKINASENTQSLTLDITDLKSGIYMFHVSSSGGSLDNANIKFVKI